MKKVTKFLTLMLTALLLCVHIIPAYVCASSEITPRYSHCNYSRCVFTIDNGDSWIDVRYTANADTFKEARLNVKIQKRFLGVFWNTVDEWNGLHFSANGHFSHLCILEETGTYRAVFTLEIYGKDGTVDVIEDTITSTYD